MEVRFLLDEDTERGLAQLLERDDHSVERVVDIDELGSSASDDEIAAYARRTDRLVVTYDSDFTAFDRTAHAGVFYCPDQQLLPFDVYRIVSNVLDAYPNRESLPPVVYLTASWL